MRKIILTVVCFAILANGLASRRVLGSDDVINRRAVLTSALNATIQVDLGGLRAGEVASVELAILNNTGQVLEFSELVTTCNCIQARTPATEVQPGSEFLVEIALSPERTTSSSDRVATISFRDRLSKADTLSVSFQYTITDIACFADRLILAEVNESNSDATLDIPLVVGPSTNLAELTFDCQGDLADCSVAVVNDKTRTMVRLTLDDLPPEGGLVGKCVLSHRRRGELDSVPVIINQQQLIKLSPSTLNFSLRDGVYRGNAVARILTDAAAPSVEGKEPARPDSVAKIAADFQFESQSHQFQISSRSPAPNFYRLVIEIPEVDLQDEDGNVVFPETGSLTITHGEKSYVIQTKMQFFQ